MSQSRIVKGVCCGEAVTLSERHGRVILRYETLFFSHGQAAKPVIPQFSFTCRFC